MTTPFSLLLYKIVSPCNLNCTYCYEYNLGDSSWMRQPTFMSVAVAEQATRRVRAHLEKHNRKRITIVFHGGEPLLAGVERLQQLVACVRKILEPEFKVDFGTQSNGVLLSSEVLEFLEQEGFQIGISCDGPPRANDLNRVYHSGRGSGSDVERALGMLRGRESSGGILCVIDLRNDPLEVWDYLSRFDPPAIDFLLPHGHWDMRPAGKADIGATPYADWLIAVFDRWFSGDRREIRVRYFEEIIEHLAGGRGSLEALGLAPVTLAVIAPDGSYEAVDTLKSVMPDAHSLGLNVHEHSLEDVLGHPKIQLRQRGLAALSSICQNCRVVQTCGGGYLPHRYARESGFANPSVYCADLLKLIDHIRRVARQSLAYPVEA